MAKVEKKDTELAMAAVLGDKAKDLKESEYFQHLLKSMRAEISKRKSELGRESFEQFKIECEKMEALGEIERRVNADIIAGKKATEKMSGKKKKGQLV